METHLTHTSPFPSPLQREGLLPSLSGWLFCFLFLGVIHPWAASFTFTQGSLATARSLHTATTLSDGRILIVGGKDSSGTATGSMEIFDPATGTCSSAGTVTARYSHTATLLPNGTVLLVGGTSNGTTALSLTEIYNPMTGSLTSLATNSLAGRFGHTATLVLGVSSVYKVWVAGGIGTAGAYLDTCGLYAPASLTTGTWASGGILPGTVRAYHTATLLGTGRVFVAGGMNTSTGYLNTTVLYTPSPTPTIVAGPTIGTARAHHTATLLTNASTPATSGVLLTGGDTTSGTYLSSSAWYISNGTAIGSMSATAIPAMSTTRALHTASLLPNGSVLIAGGTNGTVIGTYQLFTPTPSTTTGTWSTAASLNTARLSATATVLSSGQVLLAGGYGSSTALATAELFDATPSATQWASALGGPQRYGHTFSALRDGRAFLTGGYNSVYYSNVTWFDPSKTIHLRWWSAGNMHFARIGHTATLLGTGNLLIVGGYNTTDGYLNNAELIDASPASTSTAVISNITSTLADKRSEHTATLLANGKVLIAGGVNNTSGVLNTCSLYDPTANTFTATTGTMIDPRHNHTATLLPNGKVLVVGGDGSSSTPLRTAELFNPASQTWSSAGTTAVPSPIGGLTNHTATLLPNGLVLVVGKYLYLYDPATNSWASPSAPANYRTYHSATLLPDGRVLVAGGVDAITFTTLATTEIYDPATNVWSSGDDMLAARDSHKAVLLTTNEVVVAGGTAAGGYPGHEMFNVGAGYASTAPAVITTPAAPTATTIVAPALGTTIALTGTGFRGLTEASGGGGQASHGGGPLVQLRSLEGDFTTFLNPSANWSATAFTTEAIHNFPSGIATLRVFTNGIPSLGRNVRVTATTPFVSNPVSTGVTTTSTQLSATLDDDGDWVVTAWGIQYWKTSVPGTVYTLSGTPSSGSLSFLASGLVPGTGYTFKGYATNALGTSYTSTATFTPLTCTTITVTPPGTLGGWAGAPYNGDFTATGAWAPYTFNVASGSIPAGMSFNSSTGHLSGTPSTSGTKPAFTIGVLDSRGCTGVSSSVVMTFSACPTITVTDAHYSGTTIYAGDSYGELFTSTASSGGAMFSATGLPTGLSIDNYSGWIQGAPLQMGSFLIEVRSTDSNGCYGTYTYTLTIPHSTVTVTNPVTTSVPAWVPMDLPFGQSGALTTVIYTTSSTLPTGVTLQTDGHLVGNPTQLGTFPITVTATDGHGYGDSGNSFGYALTVTCNTITVTNPANAAGVVAIPFSEQFGQTGAPTGYITYTTSSTLPTGLSLDPDGTLHGTPEVSGTFPITVTGTDTLLCTGTNYTYNLVIAGNNAELSNLTLNGLSIGLMPNFLNRVSYNYTMEIPASATSVTVTPTAEDHYTGGALIEVKLNSGSYSTVTSGSTSSGMTVQNDGDTITVRVTARDTIATRTYTIVAKANGFSNTASMHYTRSGGAACPVGTSPVRVVMAGGHVNGGSSDECVEEYNTSTNLWTVQAWSNPAQGWFPSFIKVGSTPVLFVGWYAANYVGGSWDPSTNLIPTSTGRHTASALSSTTMLVAGGEGFDNYITETTITQAAIFNRVAKTWSTTGSLNVARAGHTATTLPGGKILVAGGYGRSSGYYTGELSSAEIYDPTVGTWSLVTPMNYAHAGHTATLLPSGLVLVVGGSGNSTVAELYDPDNGTGGTWTTVTPMNQGRGMHTATLLNSGKVLVVGGANIDAAALIMSSFNTITASVEIYDPTAGTGGTWTTVGNCATRRIWHTATLLPSGKVLIAGGAGLPVDDLNHLYVSTALCELFDPDSIP